MTNSIMRVLHSCGLGSNNNHTATPDQELSTFIQGNNNQEGIVEIPETRILDRRVSTMEQLRSCYNSIKEYCANNKGKVIAAASVVGTIITGGIIVAMAFHSGGKSNDITNNSTNTTSNPLILQEQEQRINTIEHINYKFVDAHTQAFIDSQNYIITQGYNQATIDTQQRVPFSCTTKDKTTYHCKDKNKSDKILYKNWMYILKEGAMRFEECIPSKEPHCQIKFMVNRSWDNKTIKWDTSSFTKSEITKNFK